MSSSQSTKTSGDRARRGRLGGPEGLGRGYPTIYVIIIAAEILLAALLLALVNVAVPKPELRGLAAAAVASSAAAIAASTYMGMRRLAADIRSLSGTCRRIGYFYLRDAIVCDLPCGALMCVARQTKKAYVSSVANAKPARDSGDFYCVRYEEGVMEGSGPAVFRGRLRALTLDGIIEGEGFAISWSYSSAEELNEACRYVSELLGLAPGFKAGGS
mgnify:CR=1 FL=1